MQLILTFFGFVAVSGITIQKYSKNKGFNGGGIYDGSNTFSLDTNTIVLFAFILAVALVVSWAYFLAARAFTKQFIWITGILNCVLAVGTAVYTFTDMNGALASSSPSSPSSASSASSPGSLASHSAW